MLAIDPIDRRLLTDTLQALQSVAALLRGLLATQPRPVPRGDWGRAIAPAGLMGRPTEIAHPDPLGSRRTRHTTESIEADQAQLTRCVEASGLSLMRLADAAGVEPSMLYRTRKGETGLTKSARLKLGTLINRGAKRAAVR